MKTDKKLSRQNWIDEQNKRAQLILKRKEREKTKAENIQNITEEEHPYSGPYYGYSDYAEDAGIYGYDLD